MAKYVILSDLHIHSYKQYNKNGIRLDNCLKVLEDAFELCQEIGSDTILFPGDLYDQVKAIPTEVVNRTIQQFEYLFNKYSDIKFIAISGNHDIANKNLVDRPAVTALTHLDEIFTNFKLIDNDKYENADLGITISGIPYYEYSEHYHIKLNESTKYLSSDDHNILMIHQTPNNISDTTIPADTDPDDPVYSYYDMVLCGHIHQRQRLAPNFVVVGSPLHRDQGDVGEEKGLLIYDTDDQSIKFFPLDYPRFLPLAKDEIGENTTDFIIPLASIDVPETDQDVDTTKFNTSLKAKTILTNYWEEADGEDQELLQVGLSFLN